jgi:AsmA protein
MIADLNLVGTFNKVPAKLALQVSNQNEKPYIKADGVIDDLDFSRFKLQTEKLLPIYMDNSALPFAWLSLINMDANLKVKSFALDRISLNNLVTKLNIANGQLNIYKISANVYGGNLSGSAKITKQGGMLKRKDNKNIIVDAIGGGGNSYNISTKQDIYNLNLQKMLEDLFSVTAISGVANLALDINANNVQSYEDLHKKLNGQIVVDAKKGAFNGVDFNLFANPAKIGIPTAPKSTIFDHLAAKFNFVDGVSRYGNLTFSSPYVVANGSGMIDFVNTTLNYKLNIKSVLPSNEQKIGSVVIPVMVSGSLFNPKINIQNMHLSAKQVIIPFNKSGKTNKINKVHNKKVSPQHKGVSK